MSNWNVRDLIVAIGREGMRALSGHFFKSKAPSKRGKSHSWLASRLTR